MKGSHEASEAAMLSSSSTISSSAKRREARPTLLEMNPAATSPWGGISPSPAIRPHRAAQGGRHPLGYGKRTWLAETSTRDAVITDGAAGVSAARYSCHYVPLYANPQTHSSSHGAEAYDEDASRGTESCFESFLRRKADVDRDSRALDGSASWTPSSSSATTTTVNGLTDVHRPKRPDHQQEVTQLITRRYRELMAAWEEWHGVMTAVGPQRFSTLLAHAQAQERLRQRQHNAEEGDAANAMVISFLRRMLRRLRGVRTSSVDASSSAFFSRFTASRMRRRHPRHKHRDVGVGAAVRPTLRWPRTRVDGGSALHVELAHWCREELLPYLLDKAQSAVAPVSLSFSRSRDRTWAHVQDAEMSNVEVVFSRGSEWCQTSMDDEATRTHGNTVAPSGSAAASLSQDVVSTASSDDFEDDNDEEARDDAAGETAASRAAPPARFTLAWIRGVYHPQSGAQTGGTPDHTNASRTDEDASKRESHHDEHVSRDNIVGRVLRLVGLRRPRPSRQGRRRRQRRYRSARDGAAQSALSALDQIVLAQVLQLMPSLWEVPLHVPPRTGPRGSADGSYGTASHDALGMPYAPLAELTRSSALAALDLSLTPTTNTCTATNSHGVGSGDDQTSGRVSGHGQSGSDVGNARITSADVQLRRSLATLEACTARHARERQWEATHPGGEAARAAVSFPTAQTARACEEGSGSSLSSSHIDSASQSRGPMHHHHSSHSALFSVVHDAMHEFTPRRAFHPPLTTTVEGTGAPLPYWQAEHEDYMTLCLQDAVVVAKQQQRTAEEAEQEDVREQHRQPLYTADTPYWQRVRVDRRTPMGDAYPGVATVTVPEPERRVRETFEEAASALCEAFAASAVQRVLDRCRGASDRAGSEWILRRVGASVSRALANVTRTTSPAAWSTARLAVDKRPASPSTDLSHGVLACIKNGTPVCLSAMTLSEEDREVLARVREKANSDDAAVSLRTAGYVVTYRQLASLRPRTWLNDQIINNYLQLLCECEAERRGGVEGFVNIGSHFYSKVQAELSIDAAKQTSLAARQGTASSSSHASSSETLPPLSATSTLLRWLRRRQHILLPYAPPPPSSPSHQKVDLSDVAQPNTTTVHTILIPVNLSGQHWALVVARKPIAAPSSSSSSSLSSAMLKGGSTSLAMRWTFYDSMRPSTGTHPRARRILHELRHVFAECERHLIHRSLLSEPDTRRPAAPSLTTSACGPCHVALAFRPSSNFSLECGTKRPFASLDAMNEAEAGMHARLDAQRQRRRCETGENPDAPSKRALSAAEKEAAHHAQLRRVAEQLVRATRRPLSELLPSSSSRANQAHSATATGVALSDGRQKDDTLRSCLWESDVTLGEDDDEGLTSSEVEWFTRGDTHAPQQMNANDCGVYVCQVAWCIVEGVAVSFSQTEEIDRVREVMTLELLAKNIMRRLPTTHMASSIDVNVFTSPVPQQTQ